MRRAGRPADGDPRRRLARGRVERRRDARPRRGAGQGSAIKRAATRATCAPQRALAARERELDQLAAAPAAAAASSPTPRAERLRTIAAMQVGQQVEQPADRGPPGRLARLRPLQVSPGRRQSPALRRFSRRQRPRAVCCRSPLSQPGMPFPVRPPPAGRSAGEPSPSTRRSSRWAHASPFPATVWVSPRTPEERSRARDRSLVPNGRRGAGLGNPRVISITVYS